MNENEFMRQQQAAVERMREMNARATPGSTRQPMPPVPSFVRVQSNRQNQPQAYPSQNRTQNADRRQTAAPRQENTAPEMSRTQPERRSSETKSGSLFGGLNLPFLDLFSKDGDASLIIGLLLILMSEKADKKLLFALVYILL